MHDEDEDHIHLGDDEIPVYVGERVELLTVGVDVGSSTSHLLFSRLRLERQGQRLSSRFAVTEREVLYRSPVILTPYAQGRTIHAEALRRFVESSYREAGLQPEDVHTGAVITTGEAARRQNARAVLELFSEQVGRFVCATAGPNLESLLAAHGSGAAELSRDGPEPLLNVDIGGGTTKFAVCRKGRVEETAAIHVGARLVAWDADGRLVRVEQAGQELAARAGLGTLQVGARPGGPDLEQLAEFLADLVLRPVTGAGGEDLPWITPPLAHPGPFRALVFSGGVAEYVYGREDRSFGDLGPQLARALRDRLGRLGLPVLEPKEAIRATCIGASQYTVQLSGDTIYLSDPAVLPVRNVPAAAVRGIPHPPTASAVAAAVRRALERLDLADGEGTFALAVHWHHGADYASLRELCAGIVQALPRTAQHPARPLLVVLDADVAGIVGELLRTEFGVAGPVVCVDQVALREFDYVDVGQPLQPQGVVPVVVKSLVFR